MISVPVADVEPRSLSNTPFPTGPWVGTIDYARSKDLPSNEKGEPFKGYTSTEGEIIAIRMGSNEPLDGQESVKNRKFFVDLCIADGEYDMTNIDLADREHKAWQLQNGVRNLMRLAIALGSAQLEGDNGSSRWVISEGFVDSLRAGEFDGTRVGFEVRHSKAKNDRIYENLGGFFPAE